MLQEKKPTKNPNQNQNKERESQNSPEMYSFYS